VATRQLDELGYYLLAGAGGVGRIAGLFGDIRGGNLIGRPASGNKAAAGLGIDFE
jgi:hypothetical protein